MGPKKVSRSTKYELQKGKTRLNKIKRITKELIYNPNNIIARQTLEKLKLQK